MLRVIFEKNGDFRAHRPSSHYFYYYFLFSLYYSLLGYIYTMFIRYATYNNVYGFLSLSKMYSHAFFPLVSRTCIVSALRFPFRRLSSVSPASASSSSSTFLSFTRLPLTFSLRHKRLEVSSYTSRESLWSLLASSYCKRRETHAEREHTKSNPFAIRQYARHAIKPSIVYTRT